MKRFKVMISIFFVVISLLLSMSAYSQADVEMVKVNGCVFNKNTGAKVLLPFVVRVWSKDGTGGSLGVNDGCFFGQIEVNSLIGDLDFIEVILKKNGKFYIQQYKLPTAHLDAGMEILGLPSGVVRYDFYLDIIN